MNTAWSSDFSYNYFRKILQAIRSNSELRLLSQAPRILKGLWKSSDTHKLILRHDVDVSLKRALRMAKIEKDFGICATYMVMTKSSLYCVGDATSRDILRKIMDMGHEIGLHIDPRPHNGITPIEGRINSACSQLEDATSSPIMSVSFHRPPEESLRGPLMIRDKVNAYTKELTGEHMERYLSDSAGHWIKGEPLPRLMNLTKPLLQLLIHPIWWDGEHKSREEHLRAFYKEETQGKPAEYMKAFHDNLIETTGIKF